MFSLFVLVVSLPCFVVAQEAVQMKNMYCNPHREVVAIDPTEHKYFPYFVELHRCSGSLSQSPKLRRCAAKQWKEITVAVQQITNLQAKPTVTVQNHTECAPECVATDDSCHKELEFWSEENCKCECLFPAEPPPSLGPKEGFSWNPFICRYECGRAPIVCPHRSQVWDKDICGCTCKLETVEECRQKNTGFDFETCSCVDVEAVRNYPSGTHPRSHMFIIILIGEACLIILLVCVIIHWVRKARSNLKDRPGKAEHGDKGPAVQPTSV